MITQEFVCNGSLEPLGLGVGIFSKVSSIQNSPTLSLNQPILNGKHFSAAGVLIGAEALILIAKFVFKLDKVPVLNVPQNQLIQMPIGELQSLLHFMGSRQNTNTPEAGTPPSVSPTPGPTFPTELPPDAPLFVGLYIVADYVNQSYTPSLYLIVPILSFPGLSGPLPLLILGLLATIFVRSVVPPETTGAKPFPKPSEWPNPSLILHPEELLSILNRFGKYFSSK